MRRGKVRIQFGFAAGHHGTGRELPLHGLGQLEIVAIGRRERPTSCIGLCREGLHHGDSQQEQHIDPTSQEHLVERHLEEIAADQHNKVIHPVIEEDVKEGSHRHHITAAVAAVPEGKEADIGQEEPEERETEIFPAQHPAAINNHRQDKQPGHPAGETRRVGIVDGEERKEYLAETFEHRFVEIGYHLRHHLPDTRNRTHLGTPRIDGHNRPEIARLDAVCRIAQRPRQKQQHDTAHRSHRGSPLLAEQEKQDDGKEYRSPHRAHIIGSHRRHDGHIEPRRTVKRHRLARRIEIQRHKGRHGADEIEHLRHGHRGKMQQVGRQAGQQHGGESHSRLSRQTPRKPEKHHQRKAQQDTVEYLEKYQIIDAQHHEE